MDFRFYEIWREPEYISRLIDGIWTSVWLTILGALFGFSLAIVLAVMRRSTRHHWMSWIAAVFALTLNFSAYYSEIIRAGLDNVDRGQIDAYESLALPKVKAFFLVIMPQAIAKVYPSLVSQFVFLFLTTGIISEIGIEELTWSGRFIADRTFRDFEVYLTLALIYVLLAMSFKALFYIGNKRSPLLLSLRSTQSICRSPPL